MRKIVSPEQEQQAREAAIIIAEYVREHPDALLCLAAGDTPTRTLVEMARMQREGMVDYRNCRLIGLDEWVGVDEQTEGGCKNYILQHVVKPLQLKPENVIFFDSCSDDLEGECAKVNEYLAHNGPIGLSLMGVGMNGHIALNEPGSSWEEVAHVVELDPVTVEVAKKYFNRPIPMTHGITLGMKQIFGSELLIVMANGTKKRNIMDLAMNGPITLDLPASALQTHPNCIVSLDAFADSN